MSAVIFFRSSKRLRSPSLHREEHAAEAADEGVVLEDRAVHVAVDQHARTHGRGRRRTPRRSQLQGALAQRDRRGAEQERDPRGRVLKRNRERGL